MISTQIIDSSYIYLQYDMDVTCLDLNSMSNKLFCTFSSKNDLETTLSTIQSQYKILFNLSDLTKLPFINRSILDKAYISLLLVVIYFVDYYNRHNIQIIKNDKNINLKNKDKNIELIQRKNILILALFVVLIIAGSLKYDEKKNIQYGSSYNMSKFLDL